MLFVLTASSPRVQLGMLAALVAALDDASVTGAAGRAVCLGTCHRAEIYVDAADGQAEIAVRQAWAKAAGLSEHDVAGALEKHSGPHAARHLFTVAAGLASAVLGEAEIGGQVAAALRRAHREETTSPLLEDLFQSACRAARRVAAETSLGQAGRSLAGVALQLAVPGDIGRAVIVGTGSFARVFMGQLRARGCEDVAIYSPSGRAGQFAHSHGARAIGGAELACEMADSDVTILCSGQGEPVLSRELAAKAAGLRGPGKPLVIADLALRPDAEQGVGLIDGVRYLGLEQIASGARADAAPAVAEASAIVTAELARLRERRAARAIDPAIVALRRHVEEVARRELEKLPGGAAGEQASQLAHRISQSLLHRPTERARQAAAAGEAREYVRALDVLYGLRVDLGAVEPGSGSL